MAVLIGDLDEVTYDLEADGELVRRTLHRHVWERGAWATVALAFQDRAPDGAWKPTKLALIRLQKTRGAWKKHASITLHAADASSLAETLASWQLASTDDPSTD